MQYFFILGRNPTLSIAEIAALLQSSKLDTIFLEASNEVMLIQTAATFDTVNFMSRLGGTIKIGQIINKFTKIEPEDIVNILKTRLNKKFYFGFSFYRLNEDIDTTNFKKTSQKIKNLGMPIKELLKEMKIQTRWVTSKETSLSSVIVKKNKLLTENGIELVFLIGKNKLYLGKTLAVQEFEELSFRDYGRPARSMRVGLMPPKLAKVMINLAQIDKSATILDPFCGFATVLEEALLWGYNNLIGSDINAETLAGAQENLEWLKKNYKLRVTGYKLIKSDVCQISTKLPPHSIDAIITEPYLGPPLQGDEPPEKIERIIKELSDLYLAAFREFKKILKPNGKIVILFPVFHTERGAHFLPILDKIKKIGFTTADPLPKELQKYPFMETTPRNSIIYSRPDQLVWREILIFKPKI